MKILFAVLLSVLIVSCSQQSTDQAQADTEMPYQMTYQRTGISGVARYENKEVVCYTFDQSQKGGISCMPKLKTGLLTIY